MRLTFYGKMLNSADNNSFSDLLSVYLKVVDYLTWIFFFIFWRHTESFKFRFSKVQDFGNFELSPLHSKSMLI